METVIDRNKIKIKISHLISKEIEISDIQSATQVSFDPLSDFGGYGYRVSADSNALIATGNEGVRLKLKNSSDYVIGTATTKSLLDYLNKLIER